MIGVVAASRRHRIVYPSNVGGFTATYIDIGPPYVQLSWNAATIASGSISHYVIDVRSIGNTIWSNAYLEVGLSYDDINIVVPEEYEYRIKAVSNLDIESQIYATTTVLTANN